MPDAADLSVRRVVAGTDRSGKPTFLSDGRPERTVSAPNGFGVSELIWFGGHPAAAADGDDPAADALGAFPADGAIAARIIRFAGEQHGSPTDEGWVRIAGDDPARAGMHRTDTLDLMVVLDGRVLLGLDDGQYEIGAGIGVIQRGTTHRWRVLGPQPCTFLSVLISPSPAPRAEGSAPSPSLGSPSDGQPSARLVTETARDGKSTATPAADPRQLQAGGVLIRDLWQTGAPVRSTEQGGDAPGAWALEPNGGGICLRTIEFAAGHDPGAAGFHRTRTIDIDLVLSGSLELSLAGSDEANETDEAGQGPTTVLERGDVVVMRAVTHRWRPAGGQPASMASVMIALVGAS
jgi:mannose-6-phosphate isomerase-like protein (cupin superfamily)